jgi:hypothetical protein
MYHARLSALRNVNVDNCRKRHRKLSESEGIREYGKLVCDVTADYGWFHPSALLRAGSDGTEVAESHESGIEMDVSGNDTVPQLWLVKMSLFAIDSLLRIR